MKGTASVVGNALKGLWSDGRGPILVAVAGGWFLSMGARMIYPVVLPHVRDAYGLDLATAGLLLTVLFLLYGIGQFPGGVLSDRFGERVILTASALVSAGTLVLVVSASSVVILFAATALFGVALSLYAVARYTLMADVYPDQLGTANGVTSAASDAGHSILPPLGGLLAGLVAWEAGLGFVIPLFLLSAGVLWVVLPSPSSASPSDSSSPASPDGASSTASQPASSSSGTSSAVPSSTSSAASSTSTSSGDSGTGQDLRAGIEALRDRTVVRGAVLLVLGICIWQAFTGFYPTYLIEEKGLSPTLASGLFGLFFALGILVQPLSGGAYDRLGIRRSLTVVMGTSGLALVVLPLVDGLAGLVAVTVLASAFLGSATITQSYLLVVLPDDVQATAFGLLRSISFTASAISPALFGAVADRGFFDEGFVVLAALAAVSILVVQRVSKGT